MPAGGGIRRRLSIDAAVPSASRHADRGGEARHAAAARSAARETAPDVQDGCRIHQLHGRAHGDARRAAYHDPPKLGANAHRVTVLSRSTMMQCEPLGVLPYASPDV